MHRYDAHVRTPSLRDAVAIAAIVVMFGSALYIRHVARTKGRWREFFTFGGNYRFYRDFWPELRAPLLVMALSIVALVLALIR